MTPPGVEHIRSPRPSASGRGVIETMTPPGVEHVVVRGTANAAIQVIETMTPPGVEHLGPPVSLPLRFFLQ